MDAVDTNGFAYMQAIISAGRQENGGFTDYVFPREGETEPYPNVLTARHLSHLAGYLEPETTRTILMLSLIHI